MDVVNKYKMAKKIDNVRQATQYYYLDLTFDQSRRGLKEIRCIDTTPHTVLSIGYSASELAHDAIKRSANNNKKLNCNS